MRKDLPKETLVTQLITKFPSLIESDDSLLFIGDATLMSHIHPVYTLLSDVMIHLNITPTYVQA